jgi:hypothetical protein
MSMLHEDLHAFLGGESPGYLVYHGYHYLGYYGCLRYHGYLGNPHPATQPHGCITMMISLPSQVSLSMRRCLTPDRPEIAGTFHIGQWSDFGEYARIVMLCIHFLTCLISVLVPNFWSLCLDMLCVECLRLVFSTYTWAEIAQSVMNGYGLGNWRLIPGRNNEFSLCHHIQIGSGSHSAICPVGTRDLSLG